MCKTYNTIGSLVDIQRQLVLHNIDEFDSVYDLIDFQKNIHTYEQQIIDKHNRLIGEEKKQLEKEIENINQYYIDSKANYNLALKQKLMSLDQEIESLLPISGIIPTITDYYKNMIIWIKIWSAKGTFRLKLISLERAIKKELPEKENRLSYITGNFQEAINQSSCNAIQNVRRKIILIESLNNSIYGAIGEHKVAQVLQRLPDDYILINDFCCSFERAIYNRKENDYIKSIQIDHLLVSPAGIFIIETKNWSERSIGNKKLRSPVEQIKRTNFALFILLESGITMLNLHFNKHHWGDRKISLRNIIVFTNKKPIEEFQYVKIVSLNELLNYVNYFNPIFSSNETRAIADFLLRKCNRQNILSRLNM